MSCSLPKYGDHNNNRNNSTDYNNDRNSNSNSTIISVNSKTVIMMGIVMMTMILTMIISIILQGWWPHHCFFWSTLVMTAPIRVADQGTCPPAFWGVNPSLRMNPWCNSSGFPENQTKRMIFRGTPPDLGNLHMMALASVNFGAPWSLTNIRWRTGSLIPRWAFSVLFPTDSWKNSVSFLSASW